MSTEIRLELPLVEKFLNTVNVKKRQMKCSCQKEYTDHVAVSYAQLKKEHQKGQRFLGRILDWIPGVPVFAGNAYACVKCGRVKLEGGLLSDQ